MATFLVIVLGCGGSPPDEPPPKAASQPAPATETAPATVPSAETRPPLDEGFAAGADVVLVTIDTLRADAVGFTGARDFPSSPTPNLDRLAAEGRVFTEAYAHNVVTLPSHANILTGLYPYQHGVRENSGFKLSSDVPTLATFLRDEGYRTGAFVAAFPLDARFGLDHGFEVYDDRYPSGTRVDQFVAAERRGDEVVALASRWWKERAGSKRFLWLHLYDPHAPYAPPEPWAGRFPGDPYLGEVAATDAYLGPLFELLEAEERRPLVVVTADHGEALGEHGELTHGLFCYQPTLAVPLFVWGPGIEPGVSRRLAGHVDVVPTVLHALGVESPPVLPGQALFAASEPRQVYFESLTSFYNRGWAPLRGVVEGGTKMIELPLPELYDLEHDPGEETNLFAQDRDRFQKLRKGLPKEETWPPAERQVSAAEAEALRSLGYLSGTAPRRSSFRPEDDPKTLIEVDAKLQRIVAAYSEGRYEDAATLAREVITARPDMALGYEHLALALRQLERPGEAIAALQEAAGRGVADPSLLRQLGLTYAENGYVREAIEVLLPFAQSDDPETLNALGIALSDAGRGGEAMAVLERSLAVDGNDPKTLETLGVVVLREGRPAAAREYLGKALELNPRLPYSWNTLGVSYAYEGRNAEAMDAWEKAIALDPAQWDALYNLGMTAARTGDRDRARRALSRYVESAPKERFAADVEKARQVLRGLG